MKHVHLIGIGGTGISSIARVLLEKGYTVSGSDRILSPLALDLRSNGAQVFEGHSASNIAGADVVVRSSAVPDDNPEVLAALARGIPVLKRSDFLGSLMAGSQAIAIAGSHGKTTTTAMMAWSLTRLGLDPTYIIGGVSRNLGKNAHAGKGKQFVIEADEYDNMFLGLSPDVILVTNVEYDHPDCFLTPNDYLQAFKTFTQCLKPGGLLVTNADQTGAASLTIEVNPSSKSCMYGLSDSADYRAVNLQPNSTGGTSFEFKHKSGSATLAKVNLKVPGEHNVRNALGVLAVHHQLGILPQSAADALSEFTGTGRRFDVIGEIDGITIIDDYAHHPTKIKATLAAARSRFPDRRLLAVWQPHTYSRTRALESDFIDSLHGADRVFITEIYASREKPENYSSRELVEKMNDSKVSYVSSLAETTLAILDTVRTGDVVIVLSAGDADQVCKSVLENLQQRKG